MVAVKPGGNTLTNRGIRKKVASKLLGSKLVKWHIGVVGVDYPFTPRPHIARAIRVHYRGVSIAGRIHPCQGHSLTVPFRAEKTIDYLLIGLRRLVVHKCFNIGRCRGQTCQVVGHSAD